MEGDPAPRGERHSARVGRPLVRTLVGHLFTVASRARFRLRVLGRRRARVAHGTLVVMNHQTDWDGPVLASLILTSAGRHGAGRLASFLTRGDLGRPGFVADYLIPNRRWSRALFGQFSLKPVTDALGLRCVPSLVDAVAGPRLERVRRVREALAGAADELARGGCVLLAPEGQFSQDGALAPIRGSVARVGPSAQWLQPVTLTYDHTAGWRAGLFVQFQEPILAANGAAGRDLEEEVAARLRGGRVFALGQVVGVLLAAGLDPALAVARAAGEDLAAGVRTVVATLREAGCTADPFLLRADPREVARRWRSWLRRAGPQGDRASAGRSALAWLDYWRHEAADGLMGLAEDERRRVLSAARSAGEAVAAAGAGAYLREEAARRALPGWGRPAGLHRWLRPLGAGAVFVATYLALRLMFQQAPREGLIAAIRGLSLPWLIVACGVNLLGYLARVPVWLAFLEGAPHPTGRREVFDLYVGAAFINNFVPLRGGDVARVIYLARQFRLGWGRALSLVAAEHVFDLVVIAGYGVAGLCLTRGAPAWAGQVVLGFLAAATVIASVLVLVAERTGGQARSRKGFIAALSFPGSALLGPSTQHRVVLGTLWANLTCPLMMYAFFRAAGLSAPLGPLLLASAVMTIGVGLPLTFANLGTYELIFGAVYTAFTGWPMAEVVSVAMVSHLAGLATVFALGALSLVHLGLEAPGPQHRPTAAGF